MLKYYFQPTVVIIISDCNLYLSGLDNLNSIYERSSCKREEWIWWAMNVKVDWLLKREFEGWSEIIEEQQAIFDQEGSNGAEQRSVINKFSCISFR